MLIYFETLHFTDMLFDTKFRELGIEERYIFMDKQSGKDFNRPQYPRFAGGTS
ncbi:hypothetical protein Back11_15610 [Paenibacillus baekrokdamisoli]|uniref:Uncharacterized protein n=1 Tax=Paenibacillus baekrokdamisoli TaxID=1712516 RepID=A0A3G9IPD0_9BACL|nr:hypothetical protein Back11_15610 [Paenibacillus baekrokdamisoli]